MIVSRRFIPFLQLYRTDPLSAKVLEKGFLIDPENDNEERRRIWSYNCDNRVTNAELGSCIPNFGYIVEEFKKLDETNPYETGLGINDVKSIELLEVSNGKVHIALMGPYNLMVGIATVTDKCCSPHKKFPDAHFYELDKYVVCD